MVVISRQVTSFMIWKKAFMLFHLILGRLEVSGTPVQLIENGFRYADQTIQLPSPIRGRWFTYLQQRVRV
jgi:hypothetical protein